MISSLKEYVFPLLREKGYTGSYPHFHKIENDSIDLISFQTDKYGGAFRVEVSAAFPESDNKNYTLYGDMTEKTLNVTATNKRYRLPGMYDGKFYYTDVYRKRTLFFGTLDTNVPANEKVTDLKGFKLIRPFDENTAKLVCEELKRQLEKAFAWLEKFKRKL